MPQSLAQARTKWSDNAAQSIWDSSIVNIMLRAAPPIIARLQMRTARRDAIALCANREEIEGLMRTTAPVVPAAKPVNEPECRRAWRSKPLRPTSTREGSRLRDVNILYPKLQNSL